MSYSVEIDVEKLKQKAGLIRWYRRFGAEFIRTAQGLAAERVHGGSGQYEREFAIELIPGNPPKLACGNTSPIAIYVEEDTRPHVIRPKPAGRRSFTNPTRPGALRWFDPPGGGEGSAVFAREVHHPGTAGQHIVRDAVSLTGARLRAST